MTPTVIETIGALAAILTTSCWIPQALRTLRTRDTRAISLTSQATFAVGICFWLVYGLLLGSWPLILANGFTLMVVGLILGLKLRYG